MRKRRAVLEIGIPAQDHGRPVLPQMRFTVGDGLSQGGQNLNLVQYLRNFSTCFFGKVQGVSRLAGFGIKRAQKKTLIDPFQIGDRVKIGL